MEQTRAHIVLIEWDGNPPPTQWYARLRKLAGLRARPQNQPDSIGVWATRGKESGMIAQEGVIVCSSESLARTIAALAEETTVLDRKTGVKVKPNILLILDAEIQSFTASIADKVALDRVQGTLGKRGRPVGKPVPYVVTCLEELRSHKVTVYDVPNCPLCSGTRILVRQGDTLGFQDPGGPIIDAWVRTRFAHGKFEIPQPGNVRPPRSPALTERSEAEFVTRFRQAPILASLETLPRDDALRIMDALFASRLHWNKERRTDARLRALTEFFRIGGRPAGVVFQEGDCPDWFDAAAPLGTERAAILALQGQQCTNVGR